MKTSSEKKSRDNWQLIGETDIYDSLTSTLNVSFKKYQSQIFT